MPARKSKIGMPELRARKDELLESIRRNGGKIQPIAAEFGVDRNNIYRFRDEDREVAQALEGARHGEAALLTIHDIRELPSAELIQAFDESLGVVKMAARKLGTRPEVLRRAISEDPRLKEIKKEVDESVADDVEWINIKTALEGKNTAMMIWAAKNVLADRGWADRPAAQSGLPLKIDIHIDALGIHGSGGAKEEVVDAEEVKEIEGE